jgi:hypothetical protein
MYRTDHHLTSCLAHLTSRLSEYDGICDPDWDDATEELEREFAELRTMLTNH